jgi:hypothetical protein
MLNRLILAIVVVVALSCCVKPKTPVPTNASAPPSTIINSWHDLIEWVFPPPRRRWINAPSA